MVTYKFPAKHLNIQRTDLIKNPDPGALVRIWFHTNSSSQISYSQLTVKIFADTRPSGKLYHIHDFARRVFDCIFDSLQARF